MYAIIEAKPDDKWVDMKINHNKEKISKRIIFIAFREREKKKNI